MLAKLSITENLLVKKTNLCSENAITAKIRAISHPHWLPASCWFGCFGWWICSLFRIQLSKYSPPQNDNQQKKNQLTAHCHNTEILRIRIFIVEIIKVDHRSWIDVPQAR